VLRDVLAGLLAGNAVARNDGGGVDLLLDQFVGVLQQLSGQDDHRGGAIADLLVLELSQLNQNP